MPAAPLLYSWYFLDCCQCCLVLPLLALCRVPALWLEMGNPGFSLSFVPVVFTEADIVLIPGSLCRRRQKENQEDLLDRVNQATLAMLNKGGAGTGTGQGAGRKLTDLAAYKSVTEMQHNNSLTVQAREHALAVGTRC